MLCFWRVASIVLLLAGIAWVVAERPGALVVSAHEDVQPAPRVGHAPERAPFASSIEAWREAHPDARRTYLLWLGGQLRGTREAISKHLASRASARTQTSERTLGRVFGILRGAVLLLLLVPLWLWRRARGRRKRLVWTTIVSCLLLSLALGASQSVVGMLTTVSTEVGAGLDPQGALVDAAFVLLEDEIAAAERGETPNRDASLAPVLGGLGTASEPDLLGRLYEQAQYIDVRAIAWAGQAMRLVYAAFEQLPRVLPWLAALLFLLALRDVFVRLWMLPFHAVRGEPRAVRQAAKRAAGALGKEFLVAIALVFLVVLVATCVRSAMGVLSTVVVEESLSTLAHFGVGMARLASAPDTLVATLSVLLLPMFLVVVLVLHAIALLWIPARGRRALRERVHQGTPLRAHGRLWRRLAAAALRLAWIPALAAVAFSLLAAALPPLDSTASGHALMAAPAQRGALLFATLGAGLLLLRGFHSLWFLLRRRRPPPPAAA